MPTPSLPITEHKSEIIAAIQAHAVVVICGETGSGKTTQIPQICLEMGRGQKGLIACTQPRRIAATTVAERVNTELGAHRHLVGWQHRFAKKTARENQIKFMTDGILLAEIRENPLLPQYDTIMVDEAHERTLNIDFILGCLKKILPKRPDLKIIISSATLETERFATFFDHAPILNIPGRTYPVTVQYAPLEEEADLAQGVAEATLSALSEQPEGDILVFLPGERDIRATSDILREQVPEGFAVIPLMASLPPGEQQRAFKTLPNQRRIVIATNVAETSVTIPGIRCVVDSGLARISRYHARAHIKRLHIEAISQASANQRMGRCGRIGPGLCIRLFSEEDFNQRPAYTEPEIRRTSLAGLILSMLDWRLGNIADFPFIQPPAATSIREGHKELLELNAISENSARSTAHATASSLPPARYHITALGRQIVQFPLEPRLARMLLAAEQQQCLRDALIVVSALACEDPLVRPADQLEAAKQHHAKFKSELSDFAGIIRLWRFFHETTPPLSRSALRRRCLENFVSYRRLCEWEDVRNQLEDQLKKARIVTDSTADSDAALHQALLSGMLSNIGTFDPESKDYKGAHGTRYSIFPGSGLYKKSSPQWIMAAELVDTARLYGRRVAAIDPAWIEPLARHLCRYHYQGEYWDAKFGTARALKTTLLYGLVISEGVRADLSRVNPSLAREMLIRKGLLEGEFPKPVPKVVQENLHFIGRHLASLHKTRSASPDLDLEHFYTRYNQLLPASCVNVPTLRNFLAHASASEIQALHFTAEDFETPPNDAAGFPNQVVLANQRTLKLSYRHQLHAEDDGITCSLHIPDIPLLPLWLSDRLTPGARLDKVSAMLRLLTHQEIIQIAKALPAELKARDIPAIAQFCLDHMDPHVPLAVALARSLSHYAQRGYCHTQWLDSNLPPHLQMRWRVLDEKNHEVFLSRSKQEVLNFYQELTALAPTLTQSTTPPSFGPSHFQEQSNITSFNFPDIPQTIPFGSAGETLTAFPALQAREKSVSIRLFSTQEAADSAHRLGLLKLIELVEGPHLKQGLRNSVSTRAQSTSRGTRQSLNSLQALASLAEASLASTSNTAAVSRLPAQPNLQADLFEGALKAVFLDNLPSLPRSALTLAQLVAARRSHFHAFYSTFSKLIHAVLNTAEDCLHELDHTSHFPAESADDIAEQIGWLFFPGFAREIPFKNLADYPRYLQAIQLRIERGRQDPSKETKKFETIQPRWHRHTAFMTNLHNQPPYHPEALEAHRWLLEELRVSLWAQELKTPTPVSPQRLDKLWESAQFYPAAPQPERPSHQPSVSPQK